MTSRDLVKNALTFKECETIPTDLHDTYGAYFTYGKGFASGVPNMKGTYSDEWGCVWEAAEDNVTGEVKVHPLEDWSDLDKFKAPWSVLKEADFSRVHETCEDTDKFIVTMWQTSANPFERMQHIRGTQNLFIDLAYGDAEIFKLRDIVHEYFMEQFRLWCDTPVDAIHIADDWGTQRSLLISPALWREFYKPLYKDYCDLARSKGKFVIMHSDGYINEIIPDLIEIGVNAINAQMFCMDMDQLARDYHHKMAFWGEIDRQGILPFGTENDCRNAVRKVANTFFPYGRTGIVGQAHWGKDIPKANFDAVYDEWKKI